MDYETKTDGWIADTQAKPTKAQQKKKRRHHAKQRVKQRENQKKTARGEEVIKEPQDQVSKAQLNNALRREIHDTRVHLRYQNVPKVERRMALRAIKNQPEEYLMERVCTDRREKLGMDAERGRVGVKEAEEPRDEEMVGEYESMGLLMDEPENGREERPEGADDMALIPYDSDGDWEPGYGPQPGKMEDEELNWGGDGLNEPKWGGQSL